MLTAMTNRIPDGGTASGRARLDRLLTRVAAGERDALAELYCCAHAAVYALAVSFLSDPDEAQDIVQDTFVRIWDSASGYRSQGSPMAWILTIARNLSRMKLRERSRLADIGEEQWQAIPADAPAVTPEDRQVLQEALASLGSEERRIVLLHAVTGLRHREIAQLLEIPLSTALSKYYRAQKKLRVLLEGDATP